MKIIPLLALVGLLAAGCTHTDNPPTGQVGNGMGGGTVGTSFSGSSGAGAKPASGSAQGVRSNNEGAQ